MASVLKMGTEPADLGILIGSSRTKLHRKQQTAFARGVEQTVRFVNELLENGVVQWEPAKKGKRESTDSHLALNEAHRVADGRQPSRDAIGDGDGEPLFARHDDLDHVEAVGAEILSQARIVAEPAFIGSEMEDEDIPDL
jgi:hypothetical protein